MIFLWLLLCSFCLCASDDQKSSTSPKIIIGSPTDQAFSCEDSRTECDVLGEKYRQIIHNRVMPMSEHPTEIEIEIDFSEYSSEPCNTGQQYQSFSQHDVVPSNTPVTPTFIELLCCCFFEPYR